jgi:hypothetical protein
MDITDPTRGGAIAQGWLARALKTHGVESPTARDMEEPNNSGMERICIVAAVLFTKYRGIVCRKVLAACRIARYLLAAHMRPVGGGGHQ